MTWCKLRGWRVRSGDALLRSASGADPRHCSLSAAEPHCAGQTPPGDPLTTLREPPTAALLRIRFLTLLAQVKQVQEQSRHQVAQARYLCSLADRFRDHHRQVIAPLREGSEVQEGG